MPEILDICLAHLYNAIQSRNVTKPSLRVITAMLVFSRDSQGNPTEDSFMLNYSMTMQYCASDQKNLMVVLVG